MSIPETEAGLKARGYSYDNTGQCRYCKRTIEWWITPRGKKMPVSVTIEKNSQQTRKAHFDDCTGYERK